jgi:predicted GNAT superfamily acetyltransferase
MSARTEVISPVPVQDDVVIRPIAEMSAMREVQELQVAIWGADPIWVAPSHMLYIVVASGGIVLGAYHNGRLIGFVLGLAGRANGTNFHASHMLGIHPAYQQHGIGAELKFRQRDEALRQGLDLMTWTFDPLEARNAHFNLHKLRAMTGTYVEDLYGPMDDDLNRGLPSDRLKVEWHLREERRRNHTGSVIPIVTSNDGFPHICLEEQDGAAVTIAVPREMQEIKRRDPDTALRWRLAIREAFQWALARGYVARDFSGGAYLLIRDDGTHATA